MTLWIRPDVAGWGQWSARRCIRAAALRRWCCSRCSGRPSSRSSTSAAAATSSPQNALGPSVIGGVAAAQPFNYVPAQRAAYERDAALGLSHVLFAKSPGGVVASARRTAHWRPIVDRVARAHKLDADMLEAIVMLESAGRADARASDDLRSAVGPDPDPRRDRPEPARPAHRRQGVRAR